MGWVPGADRAATSSAEWTEIAEDVMEITEEGTSGTAPPMAA